MIKLNKTECNKKRQDQIKRNHNMKKTGTENRTGHVKQKNSRVEFNKTVENRTQQDSLIFTNFKQCLSNIV